MPNLVMFFVLVWLFVDVQSKMQQSNDLALERRDAAVAALTGEIEKSTRELEGRIDGVVSIGLLTQLPEDQRKSIIETIRESNKLRRLGCLE